MKIIPAEAGTTAVVISRADDDLRVIELPVIGWRYEGNQFYDMPYMVLLQWGNDLRLLKLPNGVLLKLPTGERAYQDYEMFETKDAAWLHALKVLPPG